MATRVAGWERSRRKAVKLHELGQGNSTASIERYNQTYSQTQAEDPQAIKMLWILQQFESTGERIGGLFGGLKDIFSNLFSGMLEGIEEFSPLFGAAMALFESGLADLGAAWEQVKEPVMELASLIGEGLIAALGILLVVGGAVFKVIGFVINNLFAPALKL